MNLKLNISFAILFILLTINLKGQLNFKRGQIVTQNNDTILGKIYDGGDLMGRKICLFYTSEERKIKRYYPQDLKSYKIDGDKYYISKELTYKGKPNTFFTEVLLEGNYSLYYDSKNKNTSYYFEKDKGMLIPLSNVEVKIQRYSDFYYPATGYTSFTSSDGVIIPLYKDTLLHLFADDKKLIYQIHQLKYEHEDLMSRPKKCLHNICRYVSK